MKLPLPPREKLQVMVLLAQVLPVLLPTYPQRLKVAIQRTQMPSFYAVWDI
jgi:hypothetical protein|uniref:Uncharacterized protein n=1 Tax=Picea glauca TaxID=3330 RepID=A0A117NH95_PICGL|nr:hypothetical protein ABT39_MTgene4985 [Picea glauca]